MRTGRQDLPAIYPTAAQQPSSNSSLQSFDFGKVPLYFIPNKGQVDGKALFYAKTPSYTLWMTADGLVFDSAKRREKDRDRKSGGLRIVKPDPGPSIATGERDVSRIIFVNAKKSPEVAAQDSSQYRVNYFLGNDPDKWRTNIETSRAVLYRELYPNIDLKVYGIERQVEYDWMVKPGGAVEDIRFKFQNFERTEIDQDGNLILSTEFGELIHKKPWSYQELGGEKAEVESRFKRLGDDTYGFDVESYDRRYPLIIDPLILLYSTYLGGSGYDEGGSGIAVDSSGSVYITGETESSDFPVLHAFDSTWNSRGDVFVTKFAPDGRSLVYSTYLGGSLRDSGRDIALGSSGEAYIIGWTSSPDFPVLNDAYDSVLNGEDAFVARLSPLGNVLLGSTFLGGSAADSGSGIALDAAGYVYVTGNTRSPDFPVVSAYDYYWNGWDDVFVAKFTSDCGALVYSTYLGGAGGDSTAGIAIDNTGSAYVAGHTNSLDFPVLNAYDRDCSSNDIFVTKFSPDGKFLVYSTFLGGSNSEYCWGFAIDSHGSAYVTGHTYSLDFPVVNAYDPTQNGGYGYVDVFVAKFTPAGNALAFSTYLGGKKDDMPSGIAVDSAGAAYVIGMTYSSDFPVLNAIGSALKGYSDAFVTKFTPAGRSLAYSTYLGGNSSDGGGDIAVDTSQDAYVIGGTSSLDFPIANAYDPTHNGNTDFFVTKLRFIPPYQPNNFTLQRLENNYIFFKEYIHRLTWAANPEDPSRIVKYRLYRKAKDAPDTSYQRIAEVSATTFGYDDRGLKKTPLYSYRISAVADSGIESGYAEVGNN